MSATSQPDDRQDQGVEQDVLQDLDNLENTLLNRIQKDNRFESGIPLDQRALDLDFILMSGLTAPMPDESMDVIEVVDGAPKDASLPLSFFEQGICDVDDAMAPSTIDSQPLADEVLEGRASAPPKPQPPEPQPVEVPLDSEQEPEEALGAGAEDPEADDELSIQNLEEMFDTPASESQKQDFILCDDDQPDTGTRVIDSSAIMDLQDILQQEDYAPQSDTPNLPPPPAEQQYGDRYGYCDDEVTQLVDHYLKASEQSEVIELGAGAPPADESAIEEAVPLEPDHEIEEPAAELEVDEPEVVEEIALPEPELEVIEVEEPAAELEADEPEVVEEIALPESELEVIEIEEPEAELEADEPEVVEEIALSESEFEVIEIEEPAAELEADEPEAVEEIALPESELEAVELEEPVMAEDALPEPALDALETESAFALESDETEPVEEASPEPELEVVEAEEQPDIVEEFACFEPEIEDDESDLVEEVALTEPELEIVESDALADELDDELEAVEDVALPEPALDALETEYAFEVLEPEEPADDLEPEDPEIVEEVVSEPVLQFETVALSPDVDDPENVEHVAEDEEPVSEADEAEGSAAPPAPSLPIYHLAEAEQLLHELENQPRELEEEAAVVSLSSPEGQADAFMADDEMTFDELPDAAHLPVREAAGRARRSHRSQHSRTRRRVIRLSLVAAALLMIVGSLMSLYVYLKPMLSTPEAILAEAHVMAGRDEYQQASVGFERFAASSPAHPSRAEAQFLAAHYARMAHTGDFDQDQESTRKALALFDQFLRDNPTNPKAPRAWTIVAQLHYQLGEYKEAINILQDPMLRLRDPQSALPGLRTLARSYVKLGDHEAAESAYLQAAALAANYAPDADYDELGDLFKLRADGAEDPLEVQRLKTAALDNWEHAIRVPGIDPANKTKIQEKKKWLESQLAPAGANVPVQPEQSVKPPVAEPPVTAPAPEAVEPPAAATPAAATPAAEPVAAAAASGMQVDPAAEAQFLDAGVQGGAKP